MVAGERFERTRDWPGGVNMSPGPRSFFRLVFLPSDAKNPVAERPLPLDSGTWYVRALGESEIALRTGLEVASEGYGRYAGGALVEERSSLGRIARSVALYASARTGNETSDDIDPPDTCLGAGGNSLGSRRVMDSDLVSGVVRDDRMLAAADHECGSKQ